MLIEFSVKNFLSFKDKVTLSMEKGNGNEFINNVFSISNIELLKTAVIYGANASGKTNIIKALTCAIIMIRNSNIIPIDGKWNILKPFLFDTNCSNEPSEFEFIFIANEVKYKYKFSADINKIYDESLDGYFSQRPTNIFTRKNTNEYTFNDDKAKLESIKSKNTDNKLFLSTATTWNYDKTKDAYMWFTNIIDTYNCFDTMSCDDLKDYSNNEKDLKEFTLNLLKEADIFIKDLKVDYEEKDMDKKMMDMYIPPVVRNNNFKLTNIKIELTHEVKDKNNNSYLYNLDFEDESEGTKILFALSPILKRAFEKSKVIIIDELEKSLHPVLVEYLIRIFNNKKINKSNSQLIFTTHTVYLLEIDLFRRDQVWFVEKNPNTGVSDLYPLDSFSVRMNEKIGKGYINGRYGAIPFINNDIWLDDNM